MSALGQKQTSRHLQPISALGQKRTLRVGRNPPRLVFGQQLYWRAAHQQHCRLDFRLLALLPIYFIFTASPKLGRGTNKESLLRNQNLCWD
jgi:hypothetical protein